MFFANTFEAVTGKSWSPDSPDLVGFWDNVYFYNYVQEYVGDKARVRPTTEAFRRSADSFSAMLMEVKPEGILVLGRATWRNMIDGTASSVQLRTAPRDPHKYIYSYGTGASRALAAHIRHPSSAGFRPMEWTPMVEEFLSLVRGRS